MFSPAVGILITDKKSKKVNGHNFNEIKIKKNKSASEIKLNIIMFVIKELKIQSVPQRLRLLSF